jgi:putative FmdB family regulatory protein
MPFYEYCPINPASCHYCMNNFERLQKLSDKPLDRCPQCQNPVRRIISAPNVGKADVSLERGNLEKHGFTQYRKSAKGEYEKTAGKGPDFIKDK